VPLAKLFLLKIGDALKMWEEKFWAMNSENLVQLCEKMVQGAMGIIKHGIEGGRYRNNRKITLRRA
jgi:hypothetical protein